MQVLTGISCYLYPYISCDPFAIGDLFPTKARETYETLYKIQHNLLQEFSILEQKHLHTDHFRFNKG